MHNTKTKLSGVKTIFSSINKTVQLFVFSLYIRTLTESLLFMISTAKVIVWHPWMWKGGYQFAEFGMEMQVP